jgi:tRNA(fMet)-specific endonuclease VapC
MYLLDTNHCSRILQNDPVMAQKLMELDYSQINTCFVVESELYFMAYRSEKTTENLFLIDEFLKNIEIIRCDSNVAKCYGELKAQVLDKFGPKDKKKRRGYTLKKAGIGENDLWIAAVGLANDLTIVSLDRDFQRIKEAVPNLKIESWLTKPVEVEEQVESAR